MVLTYLLLVTVSLALTGFFLLQWMQGSLARRAENQLVSQSRVLAHFMSMYTQHPDDLPESTRWVMKKFPRLTKARLRIADASGRLMGDSRGNPSSRPIEPEALAALQGMPAIWYSEEDGVRVAHVSTPVELEYPEPRRIGVVDVSSKLSELDDTFEELRAKLLLALAAALAGSFLVAVVLARTLSRPVQRIREAAARIAEGELSQRVQTGGAVELSELAQTINHMAAQLSQRLGELERERNKMRTLLASVPDCVVGVDAAGRINYLNSAAEEALRGGTEALGELLHEGETPHAQELRLGDRLYRALVVPFRDEQGRLLLMRDITDVRRLEEMRNLFLSSVSHELRTPLTIIKGFASTLSEMTEDEGLKKQLGRIDTEADRLTRLVQDLLELTRLRSLQLSLERQPVVPEEVVAEVAELLSSQAALREVVLSLECAVQRAPVPVDRDRLKQVLINLLDNALKFTPSGGQVTLRTRLEGERWVLEVEDTGPGIPEADLPHLFDHFFRSRDTRLRSVQGTGLGLAIVKEIVERHGGSVSARSQVGVGSVLVVSLPAPGDLREP
ncbi:MAG: ATP-binding protein [Candidatus Eremiobacterota bacterium]